MLTELRRDYISLDDSGLGLATEKCHQLARSLSSLFWLFCFRSSTCWAGHRCCKGHCSLGVPCSERHMNVAVCPHGWQFVLMASLCPSTLPLCIQLSSRPAPWFPALMTYFRPGQIRSFLHQLLLMGPASGLFTAQPTISLGESNPYDESRTLISLTKFCFPDETPTLRSLISYHWISHREAQWRAKNNNCGHFWRCGNCQGHWNFNYSLRDEPLLIPAHILGKLPCASICSL